MNIYLARSSEVNPAATIWLGFDGDIFALYEMLKIKTGYYLSATDNYSWALQMDLDGHIIRLRTEPDSNQPFADEQ